MPGLHAGRSAVLAKPAPSARFASARSRRVSRTAPRVRNTRRASRSRTSWRAAKLAERMDLLHTRFLALRGERTAAPRTGA